MARERQWWYAASSSGTAVTTWTFASGLPVGTIQRTIATVSYWSDDPAPLGGLATGFGYVATVGPVDGAPLAVGADPADVLMRRILRFPLAAGGTQVISPRPLERWDLESQRIVETGSDLRWAFATGTPGVAWYWAVEVRVLMLLPEGP